MSALRRFWTFWVELFDRRERGDVLALFRISVGLVVAVTLIQLMMKGVDDIIWVDFKWGGYRSIGGGPMLVGWLGGPTPEVVHGLCYTAIVSGFLLALGLGGRVTAFVCLQTYMALHRINGEASGSSDILITNALWLLVLARSTATWSLDCKLRTGRFRSDVLIPSWPRYLAILQMCILYGTTGIQKISIYWTPMGGFSALYYILQQPSWPRFDHTWAAWVYPLTQIGTAVTWVWEIGFPLILVVYWFRATADRPGRLRYWCNLWDLRLLFAGVGLSMHLLILILMVVGPFSTIAMSYYWNLFHPDEVRAVFRKLGLKLGLVAPFAPAPPTD